METRPVDLQTALDQARALAERETAAAVALQGRVTELERDLLQIDPEKLAEQRDEARTANEQYAHIVESLRAEIAALKGKQP